MRLSCRSYQRTNQLCLLITAITVIQISELFKSVSPLPITRPSHPLLTAAGFENFIPDDQIFIDIHGDPSSKKDTTIRSKNVNTEKRSVYELQRERGNEPQTAGVLIYNTFEKLPHELHNWLVEMDMVRSENIERLIESAEDDDSESVENEDEEIRSRTQRAAAVNTKTLNKYLWPDNRIPYAFHSFITESGRQAAMRAMEHWMEHTCLKFVPRENSDPDYIQFVERQGCWSYVGRQGGAQSLSLGPTVDSYCKSTGVVVHEIGHAVGLLHEQSRPDRDEYIQIIWDNILEEGLRSFNKYQWSRVDLFSLPYDFSSIMHYPPYAFTKNNQKTIIPKNPEVKVMGQRKSLSPVDIRLANLLYSCPVVNNNETLENITDSIPEEGFLIQSSDALMCLDVSTKTSLSRQPLRDQHIYTGLYYVTLTHCRPDSRDQYWQWTNGDSLLHLGKFLCLTALISEDDDSDQEGNMDKLVLMHCRNGDIRQKWSCAGDFIEHANSGKCITASTTICSGDTHCTRKKRSGDLDLADEIRHFLDAPHSTEALEEEMNETSFQENSTHSITYAANLEFCDQANTRQTWSLGDRDAIQTTNQSESGIGPSNESRSICSRNDTLNHNIARCYTKDMTGTAGLYFYLTEWATCDQIGYYVAEFYHTDTVSGNGATGLITGMGCCASSSVFTGQPDTPPPTHEEDCKEIEWWNWQDTLISEGWFTCPRGMFLKGFELTTRPMYYGHYIWKVKCCKPRSSPVVYDHCYTDYGRNSEDTGIHKCRLEGYQVTGMYKKDCVGGSNSCVEEELTCCTSA